MYFAIAVILFYGISIAMLVAASTLKRSHSDYELKGFLRSYARLDEERRSREKQRVRVILQRRNAAIAARKAAAAAAAATAATAAAAAAASGSSSTAQTIAHGAAAAVRLAALGVQHGSTVELRPPATNRRPSFTATLGSALAAVCPRPRLPRAASDLHTVIVTLTVEDEKGSTPRPPAEEAPTPAAAGRDEVPAAVKALSGHRLLQRQHAVSTEVHHSPLATTVVSAVAADSVHNSIDSAEKGRPFPRYCSERSFLIKSPSTISVVSEKKSIARRNTAV